MLREHRSRFASKAFLAVTAFIALALTGSNWSIRGAAQESDFISTAAVDAQYQRAEPLLRILVTGSDFEREFQVQMTERELFAALPENLRADLNGSGMSLIKDADTISDMLSILELGDGLDANNVSEMFLLLATTVECSLSCVRCCYLDGCGCCCPDPNDPGKGP
jgi:hypothetical protein